MAEARRSLFVRAWEPNKVVTSVSQTDVDTYASARRAGTLSPLGKGKGQGDRPPVHVRDGTLDGDFRWLSSVFNWARRHKHEDGRRLLAENPLHDVEWPREKNPRRPVASHQRYQATLAHVDAVDPAGRLRCILALARYTGRRESAICGLRASDVLLSPERHRAALAASGGDERDADHADQGAIRWTAENDKQGLLFIAPLQTAARVEVDYYLQRSPRVGDVPLFPGSDPSKPVRKDVAARLLLKAELAAHLPKMAGGVFHPYRRLWASERRHQPDVDVAAAGGWKDTRALKSSYQHADAAKVRSGGRVNRCVNVSGGCFALMS